MTRIGLWDRAIRANTLFGFYVYILLANCRIRLYGLFSVLRIGYTYLGKSMGPVVKKAMGFGWFGDHYLDGFLGVAALIMTLVSFIEHRCRNDDL